jgi:hypothetical protein
VTPGVMAKHMNICIILPSAAEPIFTTIQAYLDLTQKGMRTGIRIHGCQAVLLDFFTIPGNSILLATLNHNLQQICSSRHCTQTAFNGASVYRDAHCVPPFTGIAGERPLWGRLDRGLTFFHDAQYNFAAQMAAFAAYVRLTCVRKWHNCIDGDA